MRDGPGACEPGEYELLADRWHTCFFDLSAGQRLLGQVEGSTADDAAAYLSPVRHMLPHAQVAVDLFHVVHLAVNTVGDVRRLIANPGRMRHLDLATLSN